MLQAFTDDCFYLLLRDRSNYVFHQNLDTRKSDLLWHTELLFSKPSTNIHSYASVVWLSGHVYNRQDSLQGHLVQPKMWDCIIPLLYLHCMACPEVCDDFSGYDIKIYHNLPSARQCFALPRLYWVTWVWVWTWPYCRLVEVGRR